MSRATALRAVPSWFPWRAGRPCAVPPAVGDGWSDTVRRALFGEWHRYGLGQAERSGYLREAGPSALAAAARELSRTPPILAILPADADDVAAVTGQLGAREYTRRRPGPVRQTEYRERRVIAVTRNGRARLLLGTPGVALGSADKFALHAAWAMLGGREGLLDRRLRRDRALTYALAAFSREYAEGGYGVCSAQCEPAALGVVERQIAAAIGGLARGDVDPGLLASARERLIIRYHRALRAARALTERSCAYETAGLDLAHLADYPACVAEVTVDQVARVVARHLDHDADSANA